MSLIISVDALEILDSRGTPTLEVIVKTEDGSIGKAAVPSGASTGEHEALELRDGEPLRYFGKGVKKALSYVKGPLAKCVLNKNVYDQASLDQCLIEADGTDNKSKYGANATLGLSLALVKAAAISAKKPLYQYLGGSQATLLPCPMINIINGGVHGNNGLDFQEFMIRPQGFLSFHEALRAGAEVFYALKSCLKETGYSTSVGDEGGFAPPLKSHEEALELILSAIEKAGYKAGSEISLALDCAASEFYDPATKKYRSRSTDKQIDYLRTLVKSYPIDSIEDPLDQNDWEGWAELTAVFKATLQIVGDDIFVTNPRFLKKGIKDDIANAILIKLNQIGTLTETLQTIKMAKEAGYHTVISHRSGETEDTFIADLSVATSSGQIKTGSLSRSERTAKYNRLLEIEHELGERAVYNSRTIA